MTMFNQRWTSHEQRRLMPRRDVGEVPPWRSRITFRQVVPEQNRYRSYTLALTRDLFGSWVVIRSWGRIGKPKRSVTHVFDEELEAEALAKQIARRRLLHGYSITDCE